jgi:phosphohistidine phosphatase SixA
VRAPSRAKLASLVKKAAKPVLSAVKPPRSALSAKIAASVRRAANVSPANRVNHAAKAVSSPALRASQTARALRFFARNKAAA